MPLGNELIHCSRQIKLYGETKCRCDQEKPVFGVCSNQCNGLYVFHTGHARIDEQIADVVADPRLKLAVDGCVEAFLSAAANTDYGVEEDCTSRGDGRESVIPLAENGHQVLLICSA